MICKNIKWKMKNTVNYETKKIKAYLNVITSGLWVVTELRMSKSNPMIKIKGRDIKSNLRLFLHSCLNALLNRKNNDEFVNSSLEK